MLLPPIGLFVSQVKMLPVKPAKYTPLMLKNLPLPEININGSSKNSRTVKKFNDFYKNFDYDMRKAIEKERKDLSLSSDSDSDSDSGSDSGSSSDSSSYSSYSSSYSSSGSSSGSSSSSSRSPSPVRTKEHEEYHIIYSFY